MALQKFDYETFHRPLVVGTDLWVAAELRRNAKMECIALPENSLNMKE